MTTPLVVLIFAVAMASLLVVIAAVELTRGLSRTIFNVSAGLALAALALSCWLRPPSWLAGDAAIVACAVLGGGLVGELLLSEGALVSFVVAGAVADTISALGGVTSTLVQRYVAGTSLLLQYLSFSVPYHGQVLPIVGIGDLFFASSVMFALAQLGHPGAARLLVPLGGLTLALATAFLTRFIAAVPTLALVTVAYLVVRRRILTRTRSEILDPPGPGS